MESQPGVGQPLVMVVDDDRDVREALREALEHGGYAVVEADNGRDALDCLSSQPAPAVILVDLLMPVMNGWDFVKRVQSNPALSGIPIMIVTASGRHWGYPAESVVRKPLKVSQLLAALRILAPPGATAQ
jgi:two-component system, chemotaxis family, chemotaxis protein CheY